jgi:hypothetical protein
MTIRDTPRMAPRAYPGHSDRTARLLSALDLMYRAAAPVRLRIEPTDQWARNRARTTRRAPLPVTLHLV